MRAQVLHAVGERPRLAVDYPHPQPEADEVAVRIRAAALNHRDLYITQGLYPGVRVPVVLGSDGVGELDERRVLLQPGLAWGEREDAQAPAYHVLGMPTDGTFAEWTVVPRANVYDCPEHLTDAEAAALPLAGLTAFRALFTRASAKTGDTVLVTGAGGGVASFAVQFAVAAGCRVFVTSSRAENVAAAVAQGAAGGVDYTADGWTDELRSLSGGLDVVVDGAGGEGFAQLTRLMRPGGRMAFYGGTRGKIPGLSPQLLFWRQVTIAGSTMGSPREFARMLAFVAEHELRPVVDSIRPLADLDAALDRMAAGQQRGKLVLRIAE